MVRNGAAVVLGELIGKSNKSDLMKENELAKLVLDICFDIHRNLGPGLFESVYEEILCFELKKRGLNFERQKIIPVYWYGKRMNLGFKTDIILEKKLILELKSIEYLLPVHHKQLITYLKLTDIKLGLLINFNEALLKDGIKRIVNNL